MTKITFESGAVRQSNEGKGRFDLLSPFALERLAKVCEEGSRKYEDRNWEKGMPFGVLIDHAITHLVAYMERQEDEDHLGHAFWNIMALIHFEAVHPDLDNRPRYDPVQKDLYRELDNKPGEIIYYNPKKCTRMNKYSKLLRRLKKRSVLLKRQKTS
jgi:hypothetical protein